MNTYFEIGMTVYSQAYGKGKVINIDYTEEFPVKVDFKNLLENVAYTYDGRFQDDCPVSLSTSPVSEITNTPIIVFDRGELVWVWEKNMWQARFYSHKSNGNHYVFANQSKFNVVYGVAYNAANIAKFDVMPML